MPMSEEERLEKVQRLVTAHKKTKEALESEPVTWELHPGTDIAGKWTVITAAYSGVEQTIKYLIAEECGQSIADLIGLRKGSKYPYRTHNVARLFSKLAEPTQDIVRDFYERFQSLHTYITVETVDKFLGDVSGVDGTGYERWRYTLIEDKPLPTNSPEALVAIWGVCVQIAEERVWKSPRVRMPDEALTREFSRRLERVVDDVSIDRQNAGEPFQDITAEIGSWLWRSGHPLNAFAAVLWQIGRYGVHGQADVSEWSSDALTRWGKALLRSPAIAGPTSLRAFVQRAQGHTLDGQSIRWDRNASRFETVPWSLENRKQDALPPDTVVIGDPPGYGTRLGSLWQAAKRSGYHVLENWALSGPPDEDPWFCVLELQAGSEREDRQILTIWQKRSEVYDRFYMVEQWPREAISKHVRIWIRTAEKLGEMKLG